MRKKKLKKKIKELELRVAFIEDNYQKKNPNVTMNFIPFNKNKESESLLNTYYERTINRNRQD